MIARFGAETPAAFRAFHEARGRLSPTDFRTAYADGKLGTLAKSIARLSSAPLPPGARVRVDGTDVTRDLADGACVLEPGHHDVHVEAPGRVADRQAFDLAAGEERTITPALRPEPAPSLPPPTGGTAARRTAGYVTAGVGVVGLATGAVFGVLTATAASKYDAACHDNLCSPDGMDAAKRGRFYEVASPFALGAGAVLAGLGVYLVLSDRRRVGVVPTGSGAALGGTF